MKTFKISKNILNETSDILSDYFKDIKDYSLLTPDLERDLIIKAKNGDTEARDRLIESNLRFVITCAKQYTNQGVPLIDLISAGNCGIILAIENYELEKGYRFLTFAVWYIRREILKEIYNNGRTIRYPITFISNINKVKKACDKFVHDNNKEPTDEELIELANITPKQFNSLNLNKSYCQSMETPIYENVKLQEVIADEDDSLDRTFVTEYLLQCINTLPERERKVITEYFGIGTPNRKIQEIAEDMGLSSERVRQIKKLGLKKLEKFKSTLKPLFQ